MKEIIGGIAALLVSVFALTWIVQGNDFFLYQYFGPKYENTRRQIFENTKSYRQGMVQDLANMQLEYVKAGPEEKTALRSVILHRFADIDETILSPDQRSFLAQVKHDGGL